MKTLCIIPCGSLKIWKKNSSAGPTLAKDVYIGPFASKCREYASTFYPDSYVILSAKYGFLWPDEIIPENYNVTFKKLSTNPITITDLISIARLKNLLSYDRIIVIAGKEYVAMAKQVFPGKEIHNPLDGCAGNGIMMNRLNSAIQNGCPL
jgi:hypothetical protein